MAASGWKSCFWPSRSCGLRISCTFGVSGPVLAHRDANRSEWIQRTASSAVKSGRPIELAGDAVGLVLAGDLTRICEVVQAMHTPGVDGLHDEYRTGTAFGPLKQKLAGIRSYGADSGSRARPQRGCGWPGVGLAISPDFSRDDLHHSSALSGNRHYDVIDAIATDGVDRMKYVALSGVLDTDSYRCAKVLTACTQTALWNLTTNWG